MMARFVALLAVLLGSAAEVHAQARVTIEERSLTTYPFSDPDPVPILASDRRLYPYHRFGGYTNEARPESWTVVHLENEWVDLDTVAGLMPEGVPLLPGKQTLDWISNKLVQKQHAVL